MARVKPAHGHAKIKLVWGWDLHDRWLATFPTGQKLFVDARTRPTKYREQGRALVEDWLLYLKSADGKYGDEFDLSQLAAGHLLKVVTQHTDYLFNIINGSEAELLCSRPDRPMGRVRLMGCTFGRSSSIKPDFLFCGGNLEFTYEREGVSMTHITTTIREIYWRNSPKPS